MVIVPVFEAVELFIPLTLEIIGAVEDSILVRFYSASWSTYLHIRIHGDRAPPPINMLVADIVLSILPIYPTV